MTADAESPFDILNLQVKAIRGKYGAKVVNDPEALSALLATERPDLKEEIAAFMAKRQEAAKVAAAAPPRRHPLMVALGSIPFLGPVFFAFPPTWRNRALGALPLLIVAGIVIAHNIDIGESRPSVVQLSGYNPWR